MRAVVFFDEDIHDITPRAKLSLDPGIKLLSFPKSLKGCTDLNVFSSVLSFISDNKVLIKRKVKFYFISHDRKFRRWSKSEEKQKALEFYVNVEIFKRGKKSREQISEEIAYKINTKVAE